VRVLIVGINHQIQPTRIKGASSDGTVEKFEREQKDAYARFLEAAIQERLVDFVGEEASHREEMVAQVVCERRGCSYANIEMPHKERSARGIPGGYRDEGSHFSEAEKARFDSAREADMYSRAVKQAANSASVLILCGRAHVAGLAQHFEAGGHEVETTDLQDQDWYVEDWAAHCLNL